MSRLTPGLAALLLVAFFAATFGAGLAGRLAALSLDGERFGPPASTAPAAQP